MKPSREDDTAKDQAEPGRKTARRLFFWLGVVLTPFFMITALVSSGLGHGSYYWTRILYPFSSLFIGFPFGFPIDLLQYPFYGAMLDRFRFDHSNYRILIIIVLLHLFSTLLLFSSLYRTTY